MSNLSWAKTILQQFARIGVSEFVLCPGARNAAFVKMLAACRNAQLHTFFEERSAGFFALGRAVQSRRPVAVLTTSGTAVANLLPAVVEAHYAGVPLVVISADRPRAYRGTGSPQTIVQPGIFGGHARSLGDLELEEAWELRLRASGPSHLNVCFDEPLVDGDVSEWQMEVGHWQPLVEEAGGTSVWQKASRPLVVVGGLAPERRSLVRGWLREQSAPAYFEACSGLRGDTALTRLAIQFPRLADFDGIVRVGHVPTTRLWRDLESSSVPVFSLSDLPFAGLARASAVVPLDESNLHDLRLSHPDTSAMVSADQEKFSLLSERLREFPRSELALIRRLSCEIGPDDHVYLGNSLPIREWDWAARTDVCYANCYANRGVNGIDGQISTFFGWASGQKNWALLGDLTALYDLSAPWALRGRSAGAFHIVIVNNGGGRIFQPMFNERLFENEHRLNFAHWARMWNLSYQTWTGEGPLEAQVIEILPDSAQSAALKKLL